MNEIRHQNVFSPSLFLPPLAYETVLLCLPEIVGISLSKVLCGVEGTGFKKASIFLHPRILCQKTRTAVNRNGKVIKKKLHKIHFKNHLCVTLLFPRDVICRTRHQKNSFFEMQGSFLHNMQREQKTCLNWSFCRRDILLTAPRDT